MKSLVTRFVKDESGATAIEYGLIAGLVSIVIITGLNIAGPKLKSVFEQIGNALPNAPATPPAQ
ncbi:Flp family type IVb pilin [Microvirga sp. 2TAF3]|uniref:Flp family type IVb pilin n=1 Tax=Microvirga sp. 2TAF3 TaxID=3233014 RepID=UPI003F9871EB